MENPPNANFQQDFLRSIDETQLLGILDLLSDTLFWIKDTQGHFIYANDYARRALLSNEASDSEYQGVTDHDIFPQHIAEQFLADDRRVLCGEVVENRLEMTVLQSGELGWMSTSKYPLRNRNGQVIGSYGISRQVGQSSVARQALEELAPAIHYVRHHYMEAIAVGELARQVHLSISALERRFRKHLGKSPKQFLAEVRLEKAHHSLIGSTEAVAAIADQCGYSDPGYFSRQYQKYFGETPTQTRQRTTGASDPSSGSPDFT